MASTVKRVRGGRARLRQSEPRGCKGRQCDILTRRDERSDLETANVATLPQPATLVMFDKSSPWRQNVTVTVKGVTMTRLGVYFSSTNLILIQWMKYTSMKCIERSKRTFLKIVKRDLKFFLQENFMFSVKNQYGSKFPSSYFLPFINSSLQFRTES